MSKVYVLRSCNADMTSASPQANGFQWPTSGPVKCNDWQPTAECGHGLHGLLWGIGDWSRCHLSDPAAKWLVVEVEEADIIHLGGKVKYPSGVVVYCGGLPGAQAMMAEKRLVHLAAQGDSPASTTGHAAPASTTGYAAPASTTGSRAPASTTGEFASASTTGSRAPASTTGSCASASTTGYAAPASTTGSCAPASTTGSSAPASTTGYAAPASTTGSCAPASTTGSCAPASTTGKFASASTTGSRAPASTTGEFASASTTGADSPVCCLGCNGRARAGERGSIILSRWDGMRLRHVVGYVGEAGIEQGVWYELDAHGQLVKAEIQQ